MNLFKIGDTGGGEDREVLIEQLRSWQLPHRRERCHFIGEAEGGWGGGALLAGHHSCQSTVHNGNL